MPDSKLEFAEGASPDTRNYRVDCTLLSQLVPAYQPQWTVRKGAQELYAAYQATGLTLDEFEGQRYKRIDHVNLLISQGMLDNDLRQQVAQAS